MSRRYFGTDGIRGEFGGDLVNLDFSESLGRALRRYLEEAVPDRERSIVIGRDSRRSGPELESRFIQGISDSEFRVVRIGVLPTPAVAMCTRELKADLGVVVTASHNPFTDNGIKFFSPQGHKIGDRVEARIEELIEVKSGEDVSRGEATVEDLSWIEKYRQFAGSLLPPDCLRGWKIVVDTAHGATVHSTPDVLRNYGAEIVPIGHTPDGEKINVGVGSEYPEVSARRVRLEGADLGISHDGDGDRVVLCDETGSVLDGDEVLAILAFDALRKNKLPRKTLVTTVVSNLGLDKALAKEGGCVERVAVGDRNVMAAMLHGGFALGGESSGHFVLGDLAPTGDGLVAVLRVLQILLERKQPLSQLRRAVELYPQAQCNLVVEEKVPLQEIPELADEVAQIEASLAGEGRVLIRYSGTEPKIRLLVEAALSEKMDGAMEALKISVSQYLKVKTK